MTIETNKSLVAEYPWLKLGDNYDYTLLDILPNGWRYLILEMCNKLKHKLIGHDIFDKYRVAEAKEKWNMLAWYDYLDDDFKPLPDDIHELVMEYEEKSKYICMLCGRLKPADKEICDVCKERL